MKKLIELERRIYSLKKAIRENKDNKLLYIKYKVKYWLLNRQYDKLKKKVYNKKG